MKIRQVSIMLPNKAGTLAQVSATLAQNNVNLRALIIADTPEFGIMRIIVDDVEGVGALLAKEGYVYTVSDVVAVLVDNHSGAMAQKVALLAGAGLAVEYAYAFALDSNRAVVVFRVDDNDKAAAVLGDETFTL